MYGDVGRAEQQKVAARDDDVQSGPFSQFRSHLSTRELFSHTYSSRIRIYCSAVSPQCLVSL